MKRNTTINSKTAARLFSLITSKNPRQNNFPTSSHWFYITTARETHSLLRHTLADTHTQLISQFDMLTMGFVQCITGTGVYTFDSAVYMYIPRGSRDELTIACLPLVRPSLSPSASRSSRHALHCTALEKERCGLFSIKASADTSAYASCCRGWSVERNNIVESAGAL